MSTQHTPASQGAAIARLEGSGWTFSNWISAHDDTDAQVAVMVKHMHRGSTHYAEVSPHGAVTKAEGTQA